ncbi:MAG: tRNA (N(6)-L-threonylcarbamoyladenosine(37)-C(2))-methylthiotransferase MtaB [Lachnospiraceae bacterium]|nr:tRNA (N(6)-L-threonylcarbamoyladenosine(37)-C(2))-methylthiotransferase MtaB [Lachnospiraceae bacterium]
MKKAAFHTLGCKVNTYETEVMKSQLKEHGYEIVPFHEAADVYIINTCTVTNIADQKSRQMLHKARKKNPQAVIAAVGCYAQASKEELERDETADLIIGNNQKSRLYELLEEYEAKHSRQEAVCDLKHEKSYESMFLTSTEDRTRAFLKIQDGCNQFCSYCKIPYARGRARSRALEDTIEEIRVLAGQGFKEIVLTGIHLSSYGRDLNEEKRPLLKEVILLAAEIPGIERIRLGSLEPNVITEDFIIPLAKCSKFCPHFHLSLQSGCDETLKRMNRHYTAGEYYDKCELIRRYFEHPAITTDVIAGFPQETEEEFCETCAFVEKVGFAEMHVFKYSRRKGTKADTMEGQVPEPVKTERSHKLLEIAARSQQNYLSWYQNREVEVLTEDEIQYEGETWRCGHTKEYVKCLLKNCGANELKTVTVTGATENHMLLS